MNATELSHVVLARAERVQPPLTPWIVADPEDEFTARSHAWQVVAARMRDRRA